MQGMLDERDPLSDTNLLLCDAFEKNLEITHPMLPFAKESNILTARRAHNIWILCGVLEGRILRVYDVI